MMLGPMKRKMIATGIVAFLIPTILFCAVFVMYSSSMKSKIADLEGRVAETKIYVFSGDLPINHVVTSNDIKLVEAKEESVASNAYYEIDGFGDIIGRKLKIPVQDQTMVLDTMFMYEEDYVNHDERTKEFNMISLPSDLEVGDYIDIRILFPTGQDYLVVAGEEVKQVGSTADSNSIFLDLSEEKLVKLSAAIIESYVTDSINLYAVKYVNPLQQLFEERHVDYVSKYESAVKVLQEKYATMEERNVEGEREAILDENGEPMKDENGNIMYSEPEITIEEVKVYPTVDELSINEIASNAGMNVEDAEAIREALKQNDTALLGIYRNKLEVAETPLVANYPVKAEVATLIKNNPNILDSIKNKYNVEALEQERTNLNDTSIYKYDEYTGLVKEDEGVLGSISQSLNEEIEAQRAERKEYLQSLLRASVVSGM